MKPIIYCVTKESAQDEPVVHEGLQYWVYQHQRWEDWPHYNTTINMMRTWSVDDPATFYKEIPTLKYCLLKPNVIIKNNCGMPITKMVLRPDNSYGYATKEDKKYFYIKELDNIKPVLHEISLHPSEDLLNSSNIINLTKDMIDIHGRNLKVAKEQLLEGFIMEAIPLETELEVLQCTVGRQRL